MNANQKQFKTVRLGDVGKVSTGKLDANAADLDGKYPFFTCASQTLRINTAVYDCECVLIAGNGDLNVKYYKGKFNAYQRTYILQAKDNDILLVRYLYHFMSAFIHQLRRLSIGGVIKYIKLENLLDASIPLPPIPEQKRIAEILDLADEARRKRLENLKLYDDLIRSFFLQTFGDPVSNPMGWDRRPLGSLLSSIDSGWSPICLDRPALEGEWGVLKLGAVTYCEYRPEENKALPEGQQPRKALEVLPGDLLFTRKNTYEHVAACALVRETPPKLMMSDLIFRLRIAPDAPVLSAYLHQLLIHPGKRRTVQQLAGGAAGSMPNISKEKLRTALIELPSLLLQCKFAEQVEEINAQKAREQALYKQHDELFNSLLQRAFKGEL